MAGGAEAWRRRARTRLPTRHRPGLLLPAPPQLSYPPAQEGCRRLCQSRLWPRDVTGWLPWRRQVMNQPRGKSQAALHPAGTSGHVTTGNWKNTAFHAGGGWGTACRTPACAPGGAFLSHGSRGAPAVSQGTAHSPEPRVRGRFSDCPSTTGQAQNRPGATVAAGPPDPAGQRRPLLPSPPHPASTRAAQRANGAPCLPTPAPQSAGSSHPGSCSQCFTLLRQSSHTGPLHSCLG